MNFTKRFIIAVLSLEDKVLFWPEEYERMEISARIKEQTRFSDCVGFVDGTLIPLSKRPTWNGEDFYSRKSNYAVSAMIVCDDQKLIRHCYVGWPGSTHDNRVYDNSALGMNPRAFFSGEQYLLADSAYTPSREIVPAYKKPFGGELAGDNKKFNDAHCNLRVRIEHCIGILKARFQSLKEMGVLIRDERTCCQLGLRVRCCCILHNLLLKRGDDTYDLAEEDMHGEELDDGSLQVIIPIETGISKREKIKRSLLYPQQQ